MNTFLKLISLYLRFAIFMHLLLLLFFFFLHFCLYSIHESVGWNSMYYVSNQIRNEVAENLSD